MAVNYDKGVASTTDTVSLALARFNDSRCEYECVDSTDPLLFNCELNNVVLLRVLLPNGDRTSVSINDTPEGVRELSAGFGAVLLNIIETDEYNRNISLTLSIANASLLNGGEIICDNTLRKNLLIKVMAGCQVCGKF